MHMDSLCKSCIWRIVRLRFWFHIFFYFIFIFSACMNSNCTVHAHGFTVQETKCTVHGTYNHFVQKTNNKNRYHGTIHSFKNYFVTVFSVFSKISYIRTDLTYLENLTIDYIFFIFSTHMPNFVIIGYCLLYDAQTYF